MKRKEELSDDELQAKMEALEREHQRSQNALTTIMQELSYIERQDVNYDTIEQWCKRLNRNRGRGEKIQRKDFLAMAESTDPFYANAPHHTKLAEWFVEMWKQHGDHEDPMIQVRGLHYILQNLVETDNPAKRVNEEIYLNDDSHWKELERASKYARYLGLIPYDTVEDKRTFDPIIIDFARTYSRHLSTEPAYGVGGCYLDEFPRFPDFPDFPEMPFFPQLPRYRFGMRGQQRYRIEVWAEKDTKSRIVRKICADNRLTLVVSKGEFSLSAVSKAVKRAAQYPDITTVILYISDFDPAGQSMPVAVARKFEYVLHSEDAQASIRLYPIILTYDQCIERAFPNP